MTSSSAEDRATGVYIREIIAMRDGGATREEVTQRFVAAEMPAERAAWLYSQAGKTRWRERLEPWAKAGAVVFVLGFVAGFGLMIAGNRMAAAAALLLAAFALLFTIAGVALVETSKGIDWDPRGLVPSFFMSPAPRNVRETRRSRESRRGLLVALAGVAVLGMIVSIIELRPLMALHQRGVETAGVVVDRSIVHGSKSTTHRVLVRFAVENRSYRVNVRTSRDIYDRSAPGTATRLVYDPEDPMTCQPMSKMDLSWGWIAREALAPLVMGILLLGATPLLIRSQRKQVDTKLRLARMGAVAIGTIDEATTIAIAYRFTAAGGEHQGRWVLRRRRLSFKAKPADRIAVVYDPARPDVNEPVYGLADVVEAAS